MLMNIKEFLHEARLEEEFYPGKFFVKPFVQPGEFKSHCVVMDWRSEDTIRIEVKAGITGKDLPLKALKSYPVCFQMPTYVDIKITNDNNDEDGEDEDDGENSSRGKSGGGGGKKMQKKKKLEDIKKIASRFSGHAEGKIPSFGEITQMVVMGVALAKENFTQAFTELTKQISHAKVSATEILAKGVNLVTRVQPPSFMKPKGDETASYKYDRNKNADIGLKPGFG